MRQSQRIRKLHEGDRVAVLSPSFAAPGRWPHVYELGVERLRDIFKLETVEFPTTRQIGASAEDRMRDLVAAFEDDRIKAVITSLGGDDQVTYARKLPTAPFVENPKPFLGYSDNTHIENHLWLCGVPSYYGGGLFTQFAMQGQMDDLTVEYLRYALFDEGEFSLKSSDVYNDVGLTWDDPANLARRREYEANTGWQWDGATDAEGVTWGGCLESIDEILRHGTPMPTLDDFNGIVLFTETSEEMPSAAYVSRVYRALGGRGILARVRGVLVGRAKGWEFDKPQVAEQKQDYREAQARAILDTVRHYNLNVPVVQNMDFGHTDPQICLPNGAPVRIDSSSQQVFACF